MASPLVRRLDLKGSWRCLDKGFWPADLPAGYRTVVYGHNGSGKSTLSELLLGFAEGNAPTGIVWEDEAKHRTNIAPGAAGPSSAVAVYTRKWVESNLAAFLDGESASAIVTLGREAIEAREDEDRLAEEIETLTVEASEAEKQRKVAAGKVDKLARAVQDRIVSELKVFDYEHYTKNRYSIPNVQERLRAYVGDFPNTEGHAEALKWLGEDALPALPEVVASPADIADKLADLAGLLEDTPTRNAIEALAGNPVAQAWVEQGLALHDDLDRCLFCDGTLEDERRARLAQHFDASWLEIRAKANSMLTAAATWRETLAAWHAALPEAERVDGELRSAYDDARKRAATDVESRIALLETVEATLRAKVEDPTVKPAVPDVSILDSAPSITVMAKAVAEHNERARQHDEVAAERKQTVLDHLLGSESKEFRELERQVSACAERSRTSADAAALAARRLEEVRQSKFTTKAMADTLTRDLARVYGKDHLNVAVTSDGKSYACRRGDKPATDLSDGERTTLSLLYFLRKLEDEQTSGVDPQQRIVVIDDPSSSLDREALFATHQWLIDTLNDFGQYIILTHDFSLLRLFIKSQRNGWAKSTNKIEGGDLNELRFPRVSFLEMFATSANGERASKMGALPRLLLNHTSEYAYLFEMVMAGVSDSEDERLFLLPNAARRVLEVFASYKAPHRTDFLQQLQVLVETGEGEPFRDVYDFCNRFSHGEGSESVDVLDARAIHGQIRRCMEFLRAVDSEHFERMCKATGTDITALTDAA